MRKMHHPFHLYLDNQIYFFTSHTYLGRYTLDSDIQKKGILQKIRNFFNLFEFELYAWVILINHYHLLFKVKRGSDLPKCIGKIHAGFTYETNKADGISGRKIWQNYWDRCMRSEKDFWTHMNYIHHNPVKHRHVKTMDEYELSSYRYWLSQNGSDWMSSVFLQYPVVDFSVLNDD